MREGSEPFTQERRQKLVKERKYVEEPLAWGRNCFIKLSGNGETLRRSGTREGLNAEQ